MVDSVRVRQLANELASVKGDSLRTYFRNYWKARTKPPVVAPVDTSSDTTVEDSTDSEVAGVEDAMRESVVGMETCQIALDSNRGALAQTRFDLEQANTRLDSLESAPDPIQWKSLGTSFVAGTIFGLFIPR